LESLKHLIMAALIGLVLAGGILVFIDSLNDRPNSFAELEQTFDLPVLGQIPRIRPKDRGAAPILQLNGDGDQYPMKESYRSLRSAFLYKDALHEHPEKRPKSIVITSACPNDGKSITAANFAITLAQAGSTVLLVDADLRRGVLHKIFQKPLSPGLTEVLSGECAWNSAVVQTDVPNLWLLPGGTRSRIHSANLFAMAGKFIKETAGFYDYYIFDTVPVMVADDVLSLAPHADGLMLVVRAGKTSARIAKAALDLLRLRRVNVIGLVFNAIPPTASDYHNYRYKEYYTEA
jgi:capsular exopolysaccharide synthesis family protein